MNFRKCIEYDQQVGRLMTIRGSTEPYLEAAQKIVQHEPTPILFENVRGMQLAANLFCNREKFAQSLQLPYQNFLSHLHETLNKSDPIIEESDDVYGEAEFEPAVLSQLPILTHYRRDGGPYLTAGVWIVDDPVNGRNLSYHRFMVLDERHGAVRVVENRGMHQALKHTGGEAEVAICIGVAPSILLAASFSPPETVDELELAAYFEKIRLKKCHRVNLMVPEDCEIVLEGRFTGKMASEGPFVDITNTWDKIRQQPVLEITRIAHRRNPIYHALMPGGAEHRLLMGMPKELDIYREVNQYCQCLDVCITEGGCAWLHAVVQIRKQKAEDGKKALGAAFRAHRSLKHCVIVDEDIDPRNSREVEWAIATRFQAERDLMLLIDQPSSSLDPSAIHQEGQKSRGSKMGLDATIKSNRKKRELFKRVAHETV